MRTTISIDDDILTAAKSIASQSKRTVGEVISDLARTALRPPGPKAERNGVPLLPQRAAGVIVTPEMVNAPRDEMP